MIPSPFAIPAFASLLWTMVVPLHHAVPGITSPARSGTPVMARARRLRVVWDALADRLR